MKKEIVAVYSRSGADSSPVPLLVQTAGRFDSKIYIEYGTKHINAKSIMGMMSLVIKDGDEITITAEGPDEDEAIDAMLYRISQC